MVKVRKDLTGMIFGNLKVISQTNDYVRPDGRKEAKWLCECLCEQHNIVEVVGYMLTSNQTKSCGCIRSKATTKRNRETKKKYNQYIVMDTFVIGISSNTDDEFYVSIEDFDKIKNICWNVTSEQTTKRLIGRDPKTDKSIDMYRFLGFSSHDHINRNELDNRRENLRPCTRRENNQNRSLHQNNTSGFIGVSYNKKSQKWIARISDSPYHRKVVYNGDNKQDAIIARLKAEQEYYGDFAPQKHLYERYGIEVNDNEE